MKRVNKEGPPLPITRFDATVASGALVVDTRAADAYAAGHIPGTLNIPLNQSFPTWAGSLLPYDRDLALIASDEAAGAEAKHDLSLIGLDHIVASFTPEIIDAWDADGREAARVPHIDAGSLAAGIESGALAVLDVRSAREWEAGHIAGAMNIPLGALPERLAEIPTDRPVVVHCQGGTRSAIAASLLQTSTDAMVINLAGGFGKWTSSGHPAESATAGGKVSLPR